MAERGAGLLALALLTSLSAAPAHAERLPPRDECSPVPSLAAFVRNVRSIVARRDGRALVGLVGPDAANGFGDVDPGPQGFADAWELNRPASSRVWAALRGALALGCARDGDRVVIPHLALRISDDHDPFETYVATGHAIAVRNAPNQTSGLVASLDWTIVTERQVAGISDEWVPIAEPEGYVRRSDLRSPVDYRLLLERRRGRWMIAAFVGGD